MARKPSELARKSNGNNNHRAVEHVNDIVFARLFKTAAEKCFGHPLTEPLSETDSKMLSTKILEQTGLVIGVKSIKNYSQFVTGSKVGRRENPSTATLDTFARYVLNAPYTDEGKRKDQESHYPYWFDYKSQQSDLAVKEKKPRQYTTLVVAVLIFSFLVLIVWLMSNVLKREKQVTEFSDTFTSVEEDSLRVKGWFVQRKELSTWQKRGDAPGALTLFTLVGDNWPSKNQQAGIKNLVVKEIDAVCFVTEIHLLNFFPTRNWQQAGILLSEDSTFTGKVLRLSISYNDFFGGYERSPEIVIQGLSSAASGDRSKPEEFAHMVLFNVAKGEEILVEKNMTKAALKIEKEGNHFRFLYAAGSMEGFAFKEVVSKDFSLQPRYVALFAIQGFADQEHVIPAAFDSFSFVPHDCDVK